MTAVSSRRLDAFDQWCLRRILRIPYTAHVTNAEVRLRTGQPAVTGIIRSRRLRLFGHIARVDAVEDHARALRASINRPPPDWRRPKGRPRRTWLRTVEQDLQRYNLTTSGYILHGSVRDRSIWRQVVESAMPRRGRATS